MPRSDALKRAQAAYNARTVAFNVRLSEDENRRLRQQAAALGIKPTQLIKRWIAASS
jgi:predicted DNA binding CopG/RHH family protein